MKKAIVLLSGGQDSTTCLFWAKQNFDDVVAIGFDYGQKHKVELLQAKKIAEEIAMVPYIVFPTAGLLGGSSLTDQNVSHNHGHPRDPNLPASFTAGRNALFLTIAAAYGHKWGITDIVTGVCETDYSGYYDCRGEFIRSIQHALSLGIYGEEQTDNGNGIKIHTPLMHLTKAETWKLAKELGCLDVIIEHTMTDYNGNMKMNEWGMGVIDNPASKLRADGYAVAKLNGWI